MEAVWYSETFEMKCQCAQYRNPEHCNMTAHRRENSDLRICGWQPHKEGEKSTPEAGHGACLLLRRHPRGSNLDLLAAAASRVSYVEFVLRNCDDKPCRCVLGKFRRNIALNAPTSEQHNLVQSMQ